MSAVGFDNSELRIQNYELTMI